MRDSIRQTSIIGAPLRDWLLKKSEWLDIETAVALTFAIKTFVAGLLALYTSFRLGLDEPRWALLTIYVVSSPKVA
jgi:hypothetical protein